MELWRISTNFKFFPTFGFIHKTIPFSEQNYLKDLSKQIFSFSIFFCSRLFWWKTEHCWNFLEKYWEFFDCWYWLVVLGGSTSLVDPPKTTNQISLKNCFHKFANMKCNIVSCAKCGPCSKCGRFDFFHIKIQNMQRYYKLKYTSVYEL